MIGKTLAHYKITGLLGKGGMGQLGQIETDPVSWPQHEAILEYK